MRETKRTNAEPTGVVESSLLKLKETKIKDETKITANYKNSEININNKIKETAKFVAPDKHDQELCFKNKTWVLAFCVP